MVFSVVDRNVFDDVGINLIDLDVILVGDSDLMANYPDELVRMDVVLIEEDVPDEPTFRALNIKGLFELSARERGMLHEEFPEALFTLLYVLQKFV